MLLKHFTLSLTALSLCSAQSLSDLPACASSGALAAVTATGCSVADIACICRSSSFITSLNQYTQANCSAEDYATAQQVGQSICAEAGVSLGGSTATAAVSSSTTMVATGDAMMTTSTGSASTMTEAATSSASTVMASQNRDVTVITTTRCKCEEVVETSTISMPTAVATYTGGAAGVSAKGDGEVWKDVMFGVLGLLAML